MIGSLLFKKNSIGRWLISSYTKITYTSPRPTLILHRVAPVISRTSVHYYRVRVVVCFRQFNTERNSSNMSQKLKKVCIIGSGNWGSAIAKIVGKNVQRLSHFDKRVTMYVYEEIINGKKLTEIINETHENVKYLPGHKLPENVVSIYYIILYKFKSLYGYYRGCQEADILIFVVPHQFIRTICSTLLGKIKPTAIGLSLIKGFDQAEGGGIELISHIISKHLKIQCAVLMGANLAGEVADEKFCETTIGCRDSRLAPLLRDIIQTDYFRVNIVACGAGFVDGLGLGDNTKAAVIRLGLMEMIKFVDVFYPGSKLATFFESCGVADLITTCYGGRNRKVSEAFCEIEEID
ncbi:glycerol-3-phosphate dehydrogenase [Holotrichia oblita]|uniref:Glycerol-3-phosphate dehydrogenase n=1 Tax=Holotrichia oblita TaxID=644536 RepID=A0ACB9SWY4_HOLOL|nr:glycerol-3-phosphate dehydrogenase [Holotrichia oblita]